MVMSLQHDDHELTVRYGGTELFRYVYRPDDPQLESPRPYLHPVRTLGGDLVSGYRPPDHVWHKGISLALPNVGPDNFWGGVSYRRGDGYVQLPNNGAMRHQAFAEAAVEDDVVRLAERLDWVTEPGTHLIAEQRRIAATAWPDEGAWTLAFQTTLRNATGQPIALGSPTTEGRDNAGYGGLFWRGPSSFTGGTVITPDNSGGDELMGWRGRWAAFTGQHSSGQHDETARWSTLLFRDALGEVQWFVRSTPFAAVCPAPFFSAEYPLAAGSELTLRYDIVIAEGRLGSAAGARLAGRAADADLLNDKD